MNAIIYSRVSTEDQKKNGHSLPFQEAQLIRYCNAKKYNIVGQYQEDYTAKHFERPKW